MAKKKATKKTTKKVVKKALSTEEIKDLDLDPVEDKELLESLKKDTEIDLEDDILGDIEPRITTKDKEPEATKAEVVEQKVDIKELNKVAKTENELQDMVALAKLNKVAKLEISEKLMLHYNRASKELPNFFWYQGLMLVMEGKTEAVESELKRDLY